MIHEKDKLFSINDGIIVTGPDGRTIYINEVAEKLTGWPTGEALGTSLSVRMMGEESLKRRKN